MTSSLRIALVSAFPPGQQSLNEYGLHLAEGLAARSDVEEVIVLADRLPTPAEELDLDPKIRVERCWSFNSFLTLPQLVRAIGCTKADGVIWNLQMATFGDRELPAALGLFGPMVARMTGAANGVIAHNLVDGVDLDQTLLKGHPIRQAMVKLGARVINRALVSSDYMTVTLRSYFDKLRARHPKANVFRVPHGTFDVTTQMPEPLAARPRRIVTMGKFGTYKRLETLLEAFDILREQPGNEDLHLHIGGSDHPNTPGYLEALAKSRADDKGVVFTGYVAEDDIPSFFGNALLSVFDYSSTTGSSGVLHQTASYGTIPVFPRIGDFVDVCEDEGIEGVNYTSLDAFDMARQMQQAMEDLDGSQALVDRNLQASAEFPFETVIDFHVGQIARARRLETAAPTSLARNSLA